MVLQGTLVGWGGDGRRHTKRLRTRKKNLLQWAWTPLKTETLMGGAIQSARVRIEFFESRSRM